jgi:hypothetical protein
MLHKTKVVLGQRLNYAQKESKTKCVFSGFQILKFYVIRFFFYGTFIYIEEKENENKNYYNMYKEKKREKEESMFGTLYRFLRSLLFQYLQQS